MLRKLFKLDRLLAMLYLVRRRYMRLSFYCDVLRYHVSKVYAEFKLQTVFDEVTYGRRCLKRRKGGGGYHSLEVALGLTRDEISRTTISILARLATRMNSGDICASPDGN